MANDIQRLRLMVIFNGLIFGVAKSRFVRLRIISIDVEMTMKIGLHKPMYSIEMLYPHGGVSERFPYGEPFVQQNISPETILHEVTLTIFGRDCSKYDGVGAILRMEYFLSKYFSDVLIV